MKISMTDLESFLDELRHRGPNVEPVVRVQKTYGYVAHTSKHFLTATYVRQYRPQIGIVELVATVELRYLLGEWWIFKEADFDAECDRRYDEAVAQIAAVAEEIGIGVAGGEVAAIDAT